MEKLKNELKCDQIFCIAAQPNEESVALLLLQLQKNNFNDKKRELEPTIYHGDKDDGRCLFLLPY